MARRATATACERQLRPRMRRRPILTQSVPGDRSRKSAIAPCGFFYLDALQLCQLSQGKDINGDAVVGFRQAPRAGNLAGDDQRMLERDRLSWARFADPGSVRNRGAIPIG